MKRCIFLSITLVSSLLSMEPDQPEQQEQPEFWLQSIQNDSQEPIIVKNTGEKDTRIKLSSTKTFKIKLLALTGTKIIDAPELFWSKDPKSKEYPSIAHESRPDIFLTAPFIFYPTVQTPYDICRILPSLLEIYHVRRDLKSEHREKKRYFCLHSVEKCLFSIIVKDKLFKDKDTEVKVQFLGTAASLFKQCFHKVLQFEHEKKLTIANLPEDLNELIRDAKQFAKEKKEL